MPNVAIISISDRFRKEREDKSGRVLQELVKAGMGFSSL